jgi:hypothetical protein
VVGLPELGVDLMVVVIGAFLGVGVVGSMIGFGDRGSDQSAGVQPFLEYLWVPNWHPRR